MLPTYYHPRHFAAHEFLPPEVYDHWGEKGLDYFMDIRILITADQLREFFGAPVMVNNWWWKREQGLPDDGSWLRYRGYRPPSYYVKTPQSGSQHRFGRALDCDIDGVKPHEVRDIIMNHQHQFPYIRRLEDNVNWIHFDVLNTTHRGIHLFYP